MNLLRIHDSIEMYHVLRLNKFYSFNRGRWIDGILSRGAYMFSVGPDKDSWKAMLRPLMTNSQSSGSDPLTRRKVKETVTDPPSNASTTQSDTRTTDSPSSSQSPSDTTSLPPDQSKTKLNEHKQI